MDELTLLREERQRRRLRKQRELELWSKAIKVLGYIYISALLTFITYYATLDKQYYYDGEVEDSCQDMKTLKMVNDQLFPLLDELSYKKYFRIFRVNIDNECPFWVGNFICTSKKCAVCTCNSTEIPQHWLQPQTTKIHRPALDLAFWGAERGTDPSYWIWHVEDIDNDKGVYVDLKLNPEAYTGYQGQHIWHTIYNENCFTNENQCKEERALNKLISGLHTSISTQLSEFYVNIEKNITYPNYKEYFSRVGNHEDRIKNLFFLYSVLLRSIILAGPSIRQYDINSLSFADDLRSKQIINEILQIADSQCLMPFDEKTFFREIKHETKVQYQRFIHNISKIMDCVECEKCKVFGKMQTFGLGTALKTLFTESPLEYTGTLKRNELVALINTFAKVSSSVKSIDLMYERRRKFHQNLISVIAITGATFLLFLYLMRKIYSEMDKKIARMFQNMPGQPQQSSGKQKRD